MSDYAEIFIREVCCFKSYIKLCKSETNLLAYQKLQIEGHTIQLPKETGQSDKQWSAY